MATSKHICYKPQCGPTSVGLAQARPNQSVCIDCYITSFLLFVSIAGAVVALGVLFAISFMTLAICCFVLVCFCRQSRKVKYTSLPTSWATIMYSIWYRITFLLSCTCVAAVFYTYLTVIIYFYVQSTDCMFALTVEIVLHVIAFWTGRMVYHYNKFSMISIECTTQFGSARS